jgi:hypothetical protein
VIHGNLPHFHRTTAVEPQSSMFHLLIITCPAPTAESAFSLGFNPTRTAEFPGRSSFAWARKALRRASGVWSLGGAGLFPE